MSAAVHVRWNSILDFKIRQRSVFQSNGCCTQHSSQMACVNVMHGQRTCELDRETTAALTQRILYLIPTLDQSGAEKQLCLLASELPRDEYTPIVATLTRGGQYAAMLDAAGIEVHHINKRWKLDPIAAWRLRRLIHNTQPDLLHTWLFAANSYGRLVRPSRLPVVVSERCVDSWKSGWQTILDRQLARHTQRLVGNSQSVVDFYHKLGIPDTCLRVIPNGIAAPPTDNPLDIRRAFDIPPEAPVIGYVGRLAQQKRIPDLIWAMQLLHQLRPDAHFLLVGDGPERNPLVNMIEQMEIAPQVRVTGHRDDAQQIIAGLDVFWLASEFEGMSNSIMEAMAAGIPCVCSDIPANRELIVDGETGFLSQVGDSVGYVQFTDRILADATLAKHLGTQAQRRIREQFGLQAMIQSYVTLYREVLAEPTKSPMETTAQ